jgi:hypothetical protein
VITVSPHVAIEDYERLAHSRIRSDGIAVFAGRTTDKRHLRHIRRLYGRLSADRDLDCFVRPWGDGSTMLTVVEKGADPRRIAWMGEPAFVPRPRDGTYEVSVGNLADLWREDRP